MRPPLPMAQPFITFYTPTYYRPEALRRNMESVAQQTSVERIEQIIVPDYVGYGVGPGLYGRLPWYAQACRGRFVHVLADDDVLAARDAVERLETFVEACGAEPDVIVVQAEKDSQVYPRVGHPGLRSDWPAELEGAVDVASYVLRRDVWQRFASAYGVRYAGDADHVAAMRRAGVKMVDINLRFVVGDNAHGRPEPAHVSRLEVRQ